MDFRGFDSSIILILRGGIPRPIGDFPESLSQAMLVGCNVSREIVVSGFVYNCGLMFLGLGLGGLLLSGCWNLHYLETYNT